MIVTLLGLVGTTGILPVLSDSEPGMVKKYIAGNREQVTCFTPADRSTTSLSTVMAGMKMTFTATSPLIQFSLSAVVANNVAKAGGGVGFNIGTGTPPGTNTALTGQAIISQKFFDSAFASQRLPISFTDFWGPLTVGQTYWVDANWNTSHGGTLTLSQITVCVASV
jgi:hypothetical protein